MALIKIPTYNKVQSIISGYAMMDKLSEYALSSTIGSLNELSTTSHDNIVNAINELVSIRSDVVTKEYVDSKNYLSADSNAKIYSLISGEYIPIITENEIGKLASLNTTNKDNLVQAINEIRSAILSGSLSSDSITNDVQRDIDSQSKIPSVKAVKEYIDNRFEEIENGSY